MARKKPVTIGSRHFEKQGDADEFYREILWRYDVGDVLSDEDAICVDALLRRHKDEEKKRGVGVKVFQILISDEGSRCFGVVRIDGSKEGFSYKRCISQRWE